QGSDQVVWYCDARRLGKIRWHDTLGDARVACARSQGPDALEISRDDLAHRLKQTSRSIKPTLMDQKVLAGIGNIYADEILFASRLHPERVASQLKPAELDRLHAAVGEVLHRAVEAEGSSFDAHYRTVLGLEGGFLATNAMYGRAGQPCPHCGNPIVREHIRGLIGRSTYYCPHCQPTRVRRA
ncbi:MAG: formamidopyrimidine-DNA glycosylase, partial [Planctomycetota bacterium]|nr:formamidopyrimidine-DNA glycosylase [Planctomycetota bacterium]